MAFNTPKPLAKNVIVDESVFSNFLDGVTPNSQACFQKIDSLTLSTNGGDRKYENIGIYYSAGTLTIKGADGNDWSVTNPGYVYLPHPTLLGQTVVIKLTTNFSFEDAAGTSDIIGNTFGTTASTAWTEDCPFFVYLGINDDADEVHAFLSRGSWWDYLLPNGKPSDPSADETTHHWCFDDITFADYSGNPCVCIGTIRMRKDASDDWTVQALEARDGVGRYNEERLFNMPHGQNGAISGSFIRSNPGTEPTFTGDEYYYHIKRSGTIEMLCYLHTCNGAGVGANNLSICLPMRTRYSNQQAIGINISYLSNAGLWYNCGSSGGGSNNACFIHGPNAGSLFANVSIGLGDNLYFYGHYQAY